MIPCPTCGETTRVTETRSVEQYARRRRQCSSSTCTTKITTYEIVVAADDGCAKPMGEVVLVPRRDLEDALRVLVNGLATKLSPDAVIDLVSRVLPTTTEKGTTDGNDSRATDERSPG